MHPRTFPTVVVLIAAAAVATAGTPDRPAIPKDQAQIWPASQMRWEPMPGIDGATQAPLWGHPSNGEYGALYRWPAGTTVPLHSHTHGDHGVIVSGTLVLATEGKPAVELGPGSYFSFGSGVRHTTACKAGADCLFVVHREGKFDVTMAEKK